MRKRAFSFFGILLATSIASAEYRVFDLEITDQKTGNVRHVTSNLDDIQYPGYYPLNTGETIKIGDTWMCYKNRTENYQTYCSNPRSAPREPAAAVVK